MGKRTRKVTKSAVSADTALLLHEKTIIERQMTELKERAKQINKEIAKAKTAEKRLHAGRGKKPAGRANMSPEDRLHKKSFRP
jgi:hypothetical protein